MAVEISTDPVHSKAIPDLINKLLHERQDMLVLFNRLAAMQVASPPQRAETGAEKILRTVSGLHCAGAFRSVSMP
ncbi:MAG: hypothetical protein HC808_19145 [Candidatus Competibacteraceae bacterium]|nr:hypothetical protein [Candidatus Competibacteraceae bacterium]